MSVAHQDEIGASAQSALPASTDEELVQRAQDGDGPAWEELLRRHTDLLRRHAQHLARASSGLSDEDRVDEASEIYLFLAERVRKSLGSFAGRCQLRTWIVAIIGNRAHVLKAWLRIKDPSRAEVRIPAVLRDHPAADHEIFRRLVWGLDPRRTAVELDVPESHCHDIEAMIERHSPRVAARIRANRMARSAPVRLASGDDDEGHVVHLADPGRDPHQSLVQADLETVVEQEISTVLQNLGGAARRLLYLLYDQELTVSQVTRLATTDAAGMAGLEDANHCYYLKDRALQDMIDRILRRLVATGHTPAPAGRRWLLRCVEDVLRSRGVAMTPLTPNDDPLSL